MTKEQLGILNSLLTFAAENVPGGLNADERQAVQVFGRWAQGTPFYALDMGATSAKIHNSGEILVTEHGRRRMHVRLRGEHYATLNIGPGETVELDKTEGSTIFMPIRIITDPKNTVWLIERYTAATDTWEPVGKIQGQLASDFEE